MRVRELPSPNRNARPEGARPELVVVHYTGMLDARAALDRLRDPAAAVSSHYLIDEDGAVFALVPEAERAWHAGRSWWCGRAGVNDVSVGIELANPGHEWGYRPFPDAQMAALAALARGIAGRWGLPAAAFVGHADIAPDRKDDPGELFDWRRLALEEGVGVWPEAAPRREPDEVAAGRALAAFGYPLEPEGVPLRLTLAAFQRRFRPRRVDGALDDETMGLALALAALAPGVGRG